MEGLRGVVKICFSSMYVFQKNRDLTGIREKLKA
jgi:hypothetical protein